MKNVVKVVTTFEFELDENDLEGLSKVAGEIKDIEAEIGKKASAVNSAWKIERRRETDEPAAEVNTGRGKPAAAD